MWYICVLCMCIFGIYINQYRQISTGWRVMCFTHRVDMYVYVEYGGSGYCKSLIKWFVNYYFLLVLVHARYIKLFSCFISPEFIFIIFYVYFLSPFQNWFLGDCQVLMRYTCNKLTLRSVYLFCFYTVLSLIMSRGQCFNFAPVMIWLRVNVVHKVLINSQ